MNQITAIDAERPALRPEWLKERLARHLWREDERPREILDVRISQVRETRRRLTAVYHLTLRSPDDRVCEQSYVGYVPQDDRRVTEDYRALVARSAVQPPIGRTISLIPEANLIFVAWPNDRLMNLLSEEELRRGAGRLLPRSSHGSARIEEARVTILRYVPDKRVTSRCSLVLADGPGARRTWTCIAKQYADSEKARTLHRHLGALAGAWPGSRLDGDLVLRVPQPLALDYARGIVFVQDASGTDLSAALSEIDVEAVIPGVGTLLGLLHRTPGGVRVRVAKRVYRKGELEESRDALADIVRGLPEVQPQADALLGRLEATAIDAGALTVLLHGSFRLNHVLIDGAQLTLLDLESLRTGHPAYDLANFIAALHYAEAEGRIDAGLRRRVVREFLRGYGATVPWSVDPAAVLWFLASLLINKQAGKYLRHRHADAPAKVRRMLALADDALGTAAALRSKPVTDELWTVLA
jgi:hypothetical protein